MYTHTYVCTCIRIYIGTLYSIPCGHQTRNWEFRERYRMCTPSACPACMRTRRCPGNKGTVNDRDQGETEKDTERRREPQEDTHREGRETRGWRDVARHTEMHAYTYIYV